MGITKAFEGALYLYRLPSVLLSNLLACAPLRKQLGVADGAKEVHLDALGGVDALPICPYGSLLKKSITHFSISFLQYGPSSRSVWFRHLLCLYFGKDSPEYLSTRLKEVVNDLLSFSGGRSIKVGQAEIMVFFTNCLSADLVAFFAFRGLTYFNSSNRCFRCNAKPNTHGLQPKTALVDASVFIFMYAPMNVHVDFGLHFFTNIGIRVIRIVEGYCVAAGGEAANSLYEAFTTSHLSSVGLKAGEVSDLKLLGRHVAKLRDVLPSVVSHPELPDEVRTIVAAFCNLVPLLCAFRLSCDEVEVACEFTSTLADTIHFIWPTPDNMFPYWHMCDVELSRELRHVHMSHGVGVDAFVCQAVEAMGHQVKVVAQQSGWDAETFLGKVIASLEMRFASEHDVLGIRRAGEGTGEDLYMAIEKSEACSPRFAPPMRQRKYSTSQEE